MEGASEQASAGGGGSLQHCPSSPRAPLSPRHVPPCWRPARQHWVADGSLDDPGLQADPPHQAQHTPIPLLQLRLRN